LVKLDRTATTKTGANVVTNEHRAIIELSDAEQDLVAGGIIPVEHVLQTGNGNYNYNANAWDTPAADHGFQGHNGHGARIVPLL
jgi:hypothetical protein